jgi:hypothetical protein
VRLKPKGNQRKLVTDAITIKIGRLNFVKPPPNLTHEIQRHSKAGAVGVHNTRAYFLFIKILNSSIIILTPRTEI